MLFSLVIFADEDVTCFYQKVIPEKKVLSLTYSNVEEVDALLVQTDDLKDGIYEVTITSVNNHVYNIDNTDLYIEMPYCFEICFSENAILKIKTFMGHKLGTLIWVKD